MLRRELIAAHAKTIVGCGYAWGGVGQMCTQALLNRLAAQYPEQENLLTVCPKWIGKRVYDCATLVADCLRAADIDICNGASSQWRGDYWQERGAIANMPKNKPCVLYNESANANPMGHAGIYLGDGYAVDARSSRLGVVHTALESRAWSHYAVPKGADDTVDAYTAEVVAPSGSTVRLRCAPAKSAAVVAKIKLGMEAIVFGANDGWARLYVDGKRGYMMNEYLERIVESDPTYPQEETYTIVLFDATETERAAIVAACSRVRVEQNVG